jgi:hypothetical protein
MKLEVIMTVKMLIWVPLRVKLAPLFPKSLHYLQVHTALQPATCAETVRFIKLGKTLNNVTSQINSAPWN